MNYNLKQDINQLGHFSFIMKDFIFLKMMKSQKFFKIYDKILLHYLVKVILIYVQKVSVLGN